MASRPSPPSSSARSPPAVRSSVPASQPAEVEYAVFGTVIQAGPGPHPVAAGHARQSASPRTVGSETVNKVCASGMRAIAVADALIRLGEHEMVLAGGMESMTNAPLPRARARARATASATRRWSTRCSGTGSATRGTASRCSSRPTPSAPSSASTRDDARRVGGCARTSVRSRRSTPAGSREEIVPVTIPGRKGDTVVDTDEGPRRETSAEALAALKPLTPGGTHTAGNSPGVNDGARGGRRGRRGRGRSSRADAARRHPRRRLHGRPPRPARARAGARVADRAREGRPVGRRRRPLRDQRGVRVASPSTRRGMLGVDEDTRERERRRGRPRPPARRARRPADRAPSSTSCAATAAASAARRSAPAAARATRW